MPRLLTPALQPTQVRTQRASAGLLIEVNCVIVSVVACVCVIPTAFFDYKDDGNYPKPPSYNVATSLPSYDEAERTKAESSVPLMPIRVGRRLSISQSWMHVTAGYQSNTHTDLVNPFLWQDEDFAARDDLDDVDQLRVGNDGIFMLTFFSKTCLLSETVQPSFVDLAALFCMLYSDVITSSRFVQ